MQQARGQSKRRLDSRGRPGTMQQMYQKNRRDPFVFATVLPAEAKPQRWYNPELSETQVFDVSESITSLATASSTTYTNAPILRSARVGSGFFSILSPQPARLCSLPPDGTTRTFYPCFTHTASLPSMAYDDEDIPASAFCDIPGLTPSGEHNNVNYDTITIPATEPPNRGFGPLKIRGSQTNPMATGFSLASDPRKDNGMYIWLWGCGASNGFNNYTAASTINVKLYFAGTVNYTSTITWLAAVRVYAYSATGPDIAVSEFAVSNTTSVTSAGQTIIVNISLNPILSNANYVDTSGYYRFELYEFRPVANTTLLVQYTSAQIGLTIVNPGAAPYWKGLSNMVQDNRSVFNATRVTACSFLFSNRTDPINKGGSIIATMFPREQRMWEEIANLAASRTSYQLDALPMQSNLKRYEKDFVHGMYHWFPIDQSEAPFTDMYQLGPIYRLDLQTPVTLVQINSGTLTQTFNLYIDMHLESVATANSLNGPSYPPRQTEQQMLALVRKLKTMEPFHENSTHVMEYMQRIFGRAWDAFKFSAPHLIRAATAASSGATPLGTLAAVLANMV